jgi:type II secretory pathway pseudopilin PulG
MNPWIVAVLAASAFTLVVLTVAAAASISTVRDLARSARRFQRDVGGLASEISGEAARASDRAGHLETPQRTRPN